MSAENKDLLSSIEKGTQLKHAEVAHDASKPKIEEGMNITEKCKMIKSTDLTLQVSP
jgi:hypothetical protein